jgi:hypothetical protein
MPRRSRPPVYQPPAIGYAFAPPRNPIASTKGAEKAATKAASEGTEDARDQRLG